MRCCRRRRLQLRIEVAVSLSGDRWGRAQWVDAAIVFIEEDEARDLYRRARRIAHRMTIAETAISLTAGSNAK